ncbi:MAG: hypothetical protein GY953_21360 [bacterium]|nr:hypothetical protein [bacterium]
MTLKYADLLRSMGRRKEAKKMRKRGSAILAHHSEENLLHHTLDVSEVRAFRQK